MPAPAQSIWIPGKGHTDVAALRVERVVNEYDEQLTFGRNEETGQWCVFLVRRGEQPLPILGFDHIPHPEDVLKRLYQSDSKRRGNEILDEMNRHNAQAEKEREVVASEADARLAEVAEWALRTEGKTPHKKVVLGKGRQRGGLTQ